MTRWDGIEEVRNVLLVATWIALLVLAAILLPPLDSRVEPRPILAKFFVVSTIILSLYTVIVMFVYFDRAWRRAGSVPNRVEYISWLSLETVIFLMIFVWILKILIVGVARRFGFLS